MSATLDNRAAGLGRKIAQLEQKLRERTAERDEALAREAALAEVLDAINRSSGNPRPVFEAILEKAMRLCGAAFGELHTYDGERFHTAALRGVPAAYAEVRAKSSLSGLPGSGSARILETKRPVHIPDLMAEEAYQAGLATRRAVVDLGGARTTLAVPLLKEGAVLGLIMIYRQEVRPFSDKEIALLESFAAQALIAMENARLLGELQQRTDELAARNSEYGERIEHQAATIDVLKVMSASPGDPQPVFDLIVRQARELCKTPNAVLLQFDGELVHIRAMSSGTDAWGEALARYESNFPTAPTRSSLACRAILDGEIVHTRDLDAERGIGESIRALGHLSSVNVPMVRDGRAVGAISTAAFEVDAFSPSQIELLQTFAEQAVIALASAETYRELQQRTGDLQESLEYQTATSEVLKVISRSTFDLQPVLDTLVETAARLCGADTAHIVSREGEIYRAAATFAYAPDFDEFVRTLSFSPDRGTVVGRVLLDAQVVHLEDATADPEYIVSGAVRKGARTLLGVPLLREGEPLGVIVLVRLRVEPFTERQIELVRTFADQAVIAIENTRLITETREALEQQTATAEILEVINRSPGDLAPVFEAMLDKALGLCGAAFGVLWTYDGERVHAAALRGVPPAFAEFLTRAPHPVGPDNAHGRLLRGELVVHIADVAEDKAHQSGDPIRGTLVELGGGRTLLAVPLRKDGAFLGDFVIYRTEVRPFSEKQIALLQNFAAQAVIAMENARLLTETREALEQQTATAEVLQVINSSPGDLAPVFEAMLDKALALCGAAFGGLGAWRGDRFEIVAVRGAPQSFVDYAAANELWPGPREGFARVAQGDGYIHMLDLSASKFFQSGDPLTRAMVDLAGVRSMLTVPLAKDDGVIGILVFYRQEVRAFSERQINAARNFASQTVIAMENARLLTETREALEQQTATAEVLQVINSSPGDLAPVFDAMLERAMRLCDAAFGNLWTYDGEVGRLAAIRGAPTEYRDELMRAGPQRPEPGGSLMRLVDGEPLVHIADITTGDAYRYGNAVRRMLADRAGARTVLWMPLRKDDALLGFFAIYRTEVRPFTDKQIALLENFAAQAVIAMENARLITETREALEQQTATAEVLQVINSSPGDLAPVFDAMLDKAMRLCNAAFGYLMTYDGERFQEVAHQGLPPRFAEYLPRMDQPSSSGAYARIKGGAPLVHIADLMEGDVYQTSPLRRALVDLGGARTGIVIALRKDETLLGVLTIYRQEVRPFSDKQITLLENFAAQAVIAMENARLITETREALEQQTATAEVLQVINSSPGNLAPVYAAILEKAHNLCGIAVGTLQLYDGAKVRTVAQRGVTGRFADLLREPYEPALGHPASRLLGGERIVHIMDHGVGELAKQQPGNPRAQASAQQGLRTALWVPLRKEAELLGYISALRQEVRPFSEKEIALLQNFAAQAVIAMDNARLLNEIRQRQAELRVTFDSMADGVVMFDEELRLAAWNCNFQEIIDLSDAFLGEPRTYRDYIRLLAERGEFGAVDPEDEIRRYTESAARHTTLERTRPDGRVLEVRHNPVPSGGFVLIYADITERKRSEAEIRAARDAAEEASRTIAAAYQELKTAQARLIQAEKMASLGQLTAGIAHEIKNPLNFVNNFAGLSVELLDELKAATQPAMAGLGEDSRGEIDEIVGMLTGNLEKIAEHGRRADGIVKSMLEHSRGGSGERREVDLNKLVEEALSLAYHGARAQDQNFNITLERDFAASIAPIELAPQEMTRVLLNLFGNGFYAATKRRRDGIDPDFHPMLKVTTRDPGAVVEVHIRDNGAGIPPEIRDKLFQPFFTTKPTGEGTGLGLSISWDIVTQQHGGTITVDSRVGEFTQFVIHLPRIRRATTTIEAAA